MLFKSNKIIPTKNNSISQIQYHKLYLLLIPNGITFDISTFSKAMRCSISFQRT